MVGCVSRPSPHLVTPLITALVVGLAVAAAAAGDPEGAELCPAVPDSHKVVVLDGVEIRPPASADETAAAMATLGSFQNRMRLPCRHSSTCWRLKAG